MLPALAAFPAIRRFCRDQSVPTACCWLEFGRGALSTPLRTFRRRILDMQSQVTVSLVRGGNVHALRRKTHLGLPVAETRTTRAVVQMRLKTS